MPAAPVGGCASTLRSLTCFHASKKNVDEDDMVLVRAAHLGSDQAPGIEVLGELSQPVVVKSENQRVDANGCCGAVPARAADSTALASLAPMEEKWKLEEEEKSDLWTAKEAEADGLLREGLAKARASEASEAGTVPRGSLPPRHSVLDADCMAAVQGGCWLDVARQLEAEEGGEGEVARRISARYTESLKELRHDEDVASEEALAWTEVFDAEHDVAFSFRLQDSTFQVVSSRLYEGFDPLQAFVGLCEYDLRSSYDSRCTAAELLSEECLAATDTIWRVFKKSHSGVEDNIWQISCVDALEEPLGALWLSTYTPEEEGLSELRGVTLPPPSPGAVRVGFWRTAYAIVPMFTAVPSFRLTFALTRRPSSAAYVFSKVVQKEVADILDSFGDFLRDCHDLNLRAMMSVRAPFYERVRRHLEQIAPPGCLIAAASPMLRLGFSELSALLPEEWADSAEEAAGGAVHSESAS